MSEQTLLYIRESISEARRQESNDHQLETFLKARVPTLHRTISLPNQHAERALLNFVTQYIEQVPDILEALEVYLKEAKIYEDGKVFIEIAANFFLKPPELVTTHSGLRALIDEAYLAHRMIEEVNDRLLVRCGRSLTPMDMTFSNIIVHDLLGESFANDLDLAVHYAVELLFKNSSIAERAARSDFLNHNNNSQWAEVKKRWPCFAKELSITLSLQDDTDPLMH